MHIRILSVILCVLLLFGFSACRNNTPDEPDETVTTTPSTQTTVAVIEKKLQDMLTAKEISDAVGVEMGAPAVSGQGTILTSIGVSTKAVLSVEVRERPLDAFYSMLKGYPDIQACPNLGETAWFSPVHNQLLVYGNGYMIMVELTGTDDADQNIQRLRCRQIAALLLEHL